MEQCVFLPPERCVRPRRIRVTFQTSLRSRKTPVTKRFGMEWSRIRDAPNGVPHFLWSPSSSTFIQAGIRVQRAGKRRECDIAVRHSIIRTTHCLERRDKAPLGRAAWHPSGCVAATWTLRSFIVLLERHRSTELPSLCEKK